MVTGKLDAGIDVAIVGGGLAGGLIALALARLRPELRLALIERGPHFGGQHVWSYFASDIAPEHAWLVEPLVSARRAASRLSLKMLR
jgi:lycopene beta-cyclase